MTFCYELAEMTRHHPFGVLNRKCDLLQHVRQQFQHVMPLNAYQVASGRLFVSVTDNVSKKNVVVSKYKSNEELTEVNFILTSVDCSHH